MKCDLPTLGLVLGLTYLAQVLAFLVQYAVQRGGRGVGWWLAGSASLASGYLLLVSGLVPGLPNLAFIGNPAVVLGRILILVGVLHFLGRRVAWASLLGGYGVFLVAYYHFLFVQDSLVARTVTVSAVVAACSFLTAYQLFAEGRRCARVAALRFTGAVFLLHGAFLVLVCVYTLVARPVSSYLEYAPIQVGLFIVPIVTSNLWTFGLVLMANQRLSLENLEEKEKLRHIFNAGPDAARILRLEDGLPVDVNQGFLALTGCTRTEALEPSAVAFQFWERPAEEAAFLGELAVAGACEGREHLFRRRDGQTFVGLVSGRRLLIDRVPHAVCVIRDVTARKREEAERLALEARNRQLEKAESLGRMAGAIAHLFNNHLQSVLLNLDLLSLLPEGGDPAPRLRQARHAAERAGEVSRLMLAYLGKGVGEREPQDLSEVCLGCLPALRELPGGAELAWELPVPGPRVLAHAPELQQVLQGLVCNALEAMEGREGAVRVRLGVRSAEALPEARRFPVDWTPGSAAYACLEVEDGGHGIAVADMERLFDPFFSTRFTGRGLGLPVALGIVQAHGGAMTVESRPGQGSVFAVLLPLHAEGRRPEAEPAKPGIRALAGGTVLLVDDDPGVLEATGALIACLGFELLTARDGVEGLEVYRAHAAAIRCVVTDLTMPRKDGWELLEALRQLRPGLPVVLVSGFARSQVQASRHAEHPQAFLGKPFTREQLEDALVQALA